MAAEDLRLQQGMEQESGLHIIFLQQPPLITLVLLPQLFQLHLRIIIFTLMHRFKQPKIQLLPQLQLPSQVVDSMPRLQL